MRPPKSYAMVVMWLIFFFIFVWIRLGSGYSGDYFHIVLPAQKLMNSTPAGEFVTGSHLEQSINWDLLNDVVEQDESGNVCFSVFLANYDNRDNNGTFALTLRVAESSYRVVVSANSVQDNAYHRVCYDELVLGDIKDKPATLILEGVDGVPGSSITAWLTADSSHDVAFLNGQDSERNLMFRVETIREASHKRLIAITLTLLCGLSGVCLLWPGSCRSNGV